MKFRGSKALKVLLPKSGEIKTPSEAFNRCPSCGNKNILAIDEDVVCIHCDWTSVEAHVEAQILSGCIPRLQKGGFSGVISFDENDAEVKAVRNLTRSIPTPTHPRGGHHVEAYHVA